MAKSKKVWVISNGFEDIAWGSPLEPGVFHIPANTVDTKPPKFDPAKKTCKWDGGKWVLADIVKVPTPEVKQPPMPEKPELPESPPEEEHKHEEEGSNKPEENLETYKWKRGLEYGLPHEQLEYITENGLEAWQKRVADIKKKYPKP